MLTEEQFSYLAKKYMDTVFRLAFHYTKSRSESDDITQEVLLKLYRTDKPFESEDHVRYWLIRVTVNECKRAFLSPWKRTEPIDDYAEQLAFKTPEHSELFHAVMALPQKYRVPLFLHYYEGYSCGEISQFLGGPHRLYRAGGDSAGSGLLRIRSERVRNVPGRSENGDLRHWLGGIAEQHGKRDGPPCRDLDDDPISERRIQLSRCEGEVDAQWPVSGQLGGRTCCSRALELHIHHAGD